MKFGKKFARNYLGNLFLLFNMSKLMGLKFLDAFLSTRVNKRDEFITKMYLYAASSTEQSSYFVKLSD